MNYAIAVSDRARFQLNKIMQWFFDEHPGLEKRFLFEISKAMEFIQKHPLKCQVRYKQVRIKFLINFDFGIHYIIENQTVFVLSIFHTSQNNDDWF